MSTLPCTLTLREFYDRHFLPDSGDALAASTLFSYDNHLKYWEQHTANPWLSDITEATAIEFRHALLDSGKRLGTVNSAWSTIASMLRYAGPPDGRRPGVGLIARFPKLPQLKGDTGSRDSHRTLSELFERHYVKEMRPNSLRAFRGHLRRWEKKTGGIPVREITNETVARFRQALIDEGLSPATIKSTWTSIRAALRRIGPVFDGNPWGLGIIDHVPAMRPVRQVRKLPRRVSLDDLNTLYLAAGRMTLPRVGVSPAAYWQGILVLLYTTGMRIGDAQNVQWDDVNFEARTLRLCVSKTGVEAELPLHDVAIEHLRRMPRLNDYVIARRARRNFFTHWSRWQALAGTDFGTHDVRRTACSEVDAVSRGMGQVLLLHAPNTVTTKHYLNALPELRDAIDRMEIPLAFKHGIKQSDRAESKVRRQRIELNVDKFAIPQKSVAAEFEFLSGGFAHGGRLYRLNGQTRRLLRLLVESDEPVSFVDLFREMYPGSRVRRHQTMQRRVASRVNYLRARLREMLCLPSDWNPVQAVSSKQWDTDTRYVLCLPPPSLSSDAGAA
jgi:integrase